MLSFLLPLVKSGTFRRLVVFLVGLLAVALNRRFGLELNAEEVAGVVVMAVAYLLQSASKEKAIAVAVETGKKASADVKPQSVGDGAAVLSEVAK